MRTALLSLFILLLVTPLLAEPPEEDILRPRIPVHGTFFIGFDVGMNITWFDGNPIYRAFFESEEEAVMFRSAFGIEPFGGFYVGMRLTPSLRVRLRGDYDVRVAGRKGTTIDHCPLKDPITEEIIGTVPVSVEKEYALEVAYATISLAAEYKLGQVFLYVGPSWSMPLKRKFTETDRILEPGSVCIYFPETTDTTHVIRAEVSGTDNVASVWALKVGIGYTIEMGSDLQLVPQIGFDFPFETALVSEEPYPFRGEAEGSTGTYTTTLNKHMYFRAFQASIGLRYSF